MPTPETLYPHPIEADPRWAQLVARDRLADGRFVYGVRTTGIYCRPSCGARQPLARNVALFDTPADARRAGLRACKRCRPDAPDEGSAVAVAAACRAIEAAETAPSLAVLARAAGFSPFHFHRVFKAATGVTPRAYAAAHRATRIRTELGQSRTVTEAIYDAGYASSGRFYAQSTATLGMTPSAFRAGGPGAEIRVAVGQCTLGAILVAASRKGICAILLGDDPEALLHDLQDRFPNATVIGGDPVFESWIAAVVGFVEAPKLGLDLPLDIRGTAFQQRVWEALQDIPAGHTASYADIATRIGTVKAVRAVAQACAANRIAVAIPCHRVVRTDGALSGYRWGVERKRALLDREAGR